MGIRYLGSKARVIDVLAPLIGAPDAASGRFIDGFSGTGAVASAAADLGWDVHINDHLRCARLLSTARMIAAADVPYAALGCYTQALDQVTAAPAIEGYFWREYSPASAGHAPRPRRYFTEENAARIDGMRARIREWHTSGAISRTEEDLLLADLIEATSAVANTAGTFGSFLSGWSKTALRSVALNARSLRAGSVRFTASESDVFSLRTEPEDTVYLDPPYTKRQYAAYYHVLETLAHGDEPKVTGVTGLRPWKGKASVFSYKRHALPALLRLATSIPAARILISYSDDGHIELGALTDGLVRHGAVEIHHLGSIPRYQPHGEGPPPVGEFVVEFRSSAS